jgi:hypothetical protein
MAAPPSYNPTSLIPAAGGTIHAMHGGGGGGEGTAPPGYQGGTLLPQAHATIKAFEGGGVGGGKDEEHKLIAVYAVASLLSEISQNPNEKEVIIFGNPYQLRRNIPNNKFSKDEEKVCELLGIEKATDVLKKDVIVAFYDGVCDTNRPLSMILDCEPIRRIIQSLSKVYLHKLVASRKKGVKDLFEQYERNTIVSVNIAKEQDVMNTIDGQHIYDIICSQNDDKNSTLENYNVIHSSDKGGVINRIYLKKDIKTGNHQPKTDNNAYKSTAVYITYQNVTIANICMSSADDEATQGGFLGSVIQDADIIVGEFDTTKKVYEKSFQGLYTMIITNPLNQNNMIWCKKYEEDNEKIKLEDSKSIDNLLISTIHFVSDPTVAAKIADKATANAVAAAMRASANASRAATNASKAAADASRAAGPTLKTLADVKGDARFSRIPDKIENPSTSGLAPAPDPVLAPAPDPNLDLLYAAFTGVTILTNAETASPKSAPVSPVAVQSAAPSANATVAPPKLAPTASSTAPSSNEAALQAAAKAAANAKAEANALKAQRKSLANEAVAKVEEKASTKATINAFAAAAGITANQAKNAMARGLTPDEAKAAFAPGSPVKNANKLFLNPEPAAVAAAAPSAAPSTNKAVKPVAWDDSNEPNEGSSSVSGSVKRNYEALALGEAEVNELFKNDEKQLYEELKKTPTIKELSDLITSASTGASKPAASKPVVTKTKEKVDELRDIISSSPKTNKLAAIRDDISKLKSVFITAAPFDLPESIEKKLAEYGRQLDKIYGSVNIGNISAKTAEYNKIKVELITFYTMIENSYLSTMGGKRRKSRSKSRKRRSYKKRITYPKRRTRKN